jgi:diguanylate cyclase (GGDEF)-like protein
VKANHGSQGARATVAVLGVLATVYVVLPDTTLQDVWYEALSFAAIALAWWGLHRRRRVQAGAWRLVLAGFTLWVLGDVLSTLEQSVWQVTAYPVYSDAIYLPSYAVMGAGVLALARGRRSHHDLSVVLDACIIAVGTAVLAGVFVIGPIAEDSSLTLAGKLVGAAYPLLDVLLLGVLVRVWTTPGSRTPAFRLLATALLLVLLGDAVYDVSLVTTSSIASSPANDLFWLYGYVLVAAACWSSDRVENRRSSDRPTGVRARTQLVALTGGLLLPGVTLVVDGADGGPLRWPVIGLGSAVLSVLVLVRMAGLLRVVQVQAIQLAALAQSDALTGAPNRRSWDHELSLACQQARENDESLCVGLIDLDHFKNYNDTHGHQAGDLLLREAVARWTELLEDGDLLARYGGEEFTVLFPRRSLVEARTRLDLLRRATPGTETFSAGVAMWDATTPPAEVVRAADEALYDAKRSGRDRVCVAGGSTSGGVVPDPVVVLQPIVELSTGTVVAMEALSRFEGEDTLAVFERAQQSGEGPALEARAIRAALLCRPAGLVLTLNVSLLSLLHQEVLDALPADLTGLTLEITEHQDAWADPALEQVLHGLRRRGVKLAVDDWGRGFSNLDRLLRLRPEVVKIDMSLVHGIESGYHRAMVKSVTGWADEVGAVVCAEGVETEAQRRTLIELGVHTAQGYLFGAPAVPGTYSPAPALTPTAHASQRSGPKTS